VTNNAGSSWLAMLFMLELWLGDPCPALKVEYRGRHAIMSRRLEVFHRAFLA
jgi:hypothetical protein